MVSNTDGGSLAQQEEMRWGKKHRGRGEGTGELSDVIRAGKKEAEGKSRKYAL